MDTIIKTFKESAIIPVFYHPDLVVANKVVEVCKQNGLQVFEFTNRGENAEGIFRELAKTQARDKNFVLGAGTVFTVTDAALFIRAGAKFIVSPVFSEEVAIFCQKQNVPYVPGCGTVTEVYRAFNMGCKLIKVYPANALGPGFVKSVKAVLPQVEIMPTGGIFPAENELAPWFKAGAACVGMGSQLFDLTLLNNGEFNKLTSKINEAVLSLKKIR